MAVATWPTMAAATADQLAAGRRPASGTIGSRWPRGRGHLAGHGRSQKVNFRPWHVTSFHASSAHVCMFVMFVSECVLGARLVCGTGESADDQKTMTYCRLLRLALLAAMMPATGATPPPSGPPAPPWTGPPVGHPSSCPAPAAAGPAPTFNPPTVADPPAVAAHHAPVPAPAPPATVPPANTFTSFTTQYMNFVLTASNIMPTANQHLVYTS